jgi:adenosylcobinamide kinase/adenosylcobinamide-phosphate guanylyltransferase
MARLILVTGGARSGKSSYALNVAEKISRKKLFIATCPQLDSEISERIRRHTEERKGRGWETIEETINLDHLFPRRVQDMEVVLIDCITLWVSNILYMLGEENVDDCKIEELCSRWLKKMTEYQGTVICVTNEVGLGIVPDNPLARKYRDLVGTCNQLLGKKADEVILVSCGIPLSIK